MTDFLAPFVGAYQNAVTMSVVMVLIAALVAAAIVGFLNRKRLLAALKNPEDVSETLDRAAEVVVTMPQSVTGLAAQFLATGVKKSIDEAEGTPGGSAAEPRALPKVGE